MIRLFQNSNSRIYQIIDNQQMISIYVSIDTPVFDGLISFYSNIIIEKFEENSNKMIRYTFLKWIKIIYKGKLK